MSQARADKAAADKNVKTLRDLLKRPENKLCADCKRNDPRWASWNLGVFVCIRCSGIHRGMGTHISKVKSVDLDVWTPEQLQSVQKWGNRRANLYWEAHLKAGHVPPDHKIDSFIRSKYESKRWALEGPPPADPATLDDDPATAPLVAPAPTTAGPPAPPPANTRPQAQQVATAAASGRQPHTLLSLNPSARPAPSLAPPAGTAQAAAAAAAPADAGLFSLDFHAPTQATAKADILSLFAQPAPAGFVPGHGHSGSQSGFASQGYAQQGAAPQHPTYAQQQPGFAQQQPAYTHQQSGFAQQQPAYAPQQQAFAQGFSGVPQGYAAPFSPTHVATPTATTFGFAAQGQGQPQSMMGTSGAGMWGTSSGWSPPAQPAPPSLWTTPGQAAGNVWAAPAPAQSSLWDAAPAAKKEDAFSDLWK